jgi:hypothetical protein
MITTNTKEQTIFEPRKINTFPETDLKKLADEILSQGPEAAMPKNLPDGWLRLIGRDLREAQRAGLQGRHEDKAINLAAPILIVAALLAEKKNAGQSNRNLTTKTVYDGIRKLELAIIDEIVGRETGIFLRKETMETIV